MAKRRHINFQFGNLENIKSCRAAGLPAFYIDQPHGRLRGIIFKDKESALKLKNLAESAINLFEKGEGSIVEGEK